MDRCEDLSKCSPCSLGNLTKPSVVFCPVCEESLCIECKEHHKRSKLLRGHQLVAFDDFRELPPLLQNIRQFCETHGDVLEFFCQSHDEVCCKRCATTIHSKCNESVKLLQDLIGTTVTCISFDDISKTLSDFEVNTNAAIRDRERNKDDLAGQKQTILQDIKLRRQKLNEHLDKLEAQVKGQLDSQFDQATTHISKTLKSLRDRHAEMVEITRSINQIKESNVNSIPYLFICKRVIDSKVEKLEKEIKDEYGSNAFFNTSLEYRAEETEVVTSDNARPLGQVVTEVDKSPRFTLQMTRPMGAQGSNVQINDIQTVKLSLKDTITLTDVGEIRGCTVFKDGSVIVLESQGYGKKSQGYAENRLIKICNKIEVRSAIFTRGAFDVVHVEDNTVAVTTGGNGQIIRIYMYEGESLKIVHLPFANYNEPKMWCYGATVQEKSIIFVSGNRKIEKVCTETGRVSLITDIYVSDYRSLYIASDEDRYYLTTGEKDTVTCIDGNGRECWTFNQPEHLKYPLGITIDTNSNLYVAGYETNNVVMISPNGKRHREVLSSKDGLEKPRAIYFDKERSQLLVCNLNGPVFLFQVI